MCKECTASASCTLLLHTAVASPSPPLLPRHLFVSNICCPCLCPLHPTHLPPLSLLLPLPPATQAQVLTALREVGRSLGLAVRPYSVTPGASFPSFVASMARTGVLVARHGPLLANALFLPPGAVVLELLPYNWEWRGISEIYLNLTRSVGSVHHFAWKANSSEVGRLLVWVVHQRGGGIKREAR